MAMSGESLAARWREALSSRFSGQYNDEHMREMAQCIVDEITENMEIVVVIYDTESGAWIPTGSASADHGTII